MLKTILVLPDGTELCSGINEHNNVRAVTVTQKVNSETELMPGAVCPAVLEATLQTPRGALTIGEGSEITLYREDDAGSRHKVGLFTMEKPHRTSANLYKITAYDRISRLDKDLTDWLSSLDGWPYTVMTFARMVAKACGLTLKNTSLLNGSYRIRKFTGQNITGRKLMEWIGQICAKFCRATADGAIEFAWYENKYSIPVAPSAFTQAGVGYQVTYANEKLAVVSTAVKASGEGNVTVSGLAVVSDDGDGKVKLAVDDGQRTGIGYFLGGLSYVDYEVAPVEKVQIRLTQDDVGAVYPQVTGEGNTYTITGNYLLTNEDATALQAVAEGVYRVLAQVKYTPCKVSVPANFHLRAGDKLQITDANGKRITAYLMTKTQKGQRDTFECTGSARRNSPEAVNAENFKSVSGKLMEVRKSIDALNVKAIDLNEKLAGNTKQLTEKIAEVDVKADGISASVSSLDKKVDKNQNALTESISKVDVKADGISASVSSLNKKVDENQDTLTESISEVDVKADGISASVSSLDKKVDRNKDSLTESISEVDAKADGISDSVSSLDKKVDSNAEAVAKRLAEVKLDTDGITASVSSVQEQIGQNQDTVNKQISEVSGKIDNVAGDAARNAENIKNVKQSVTTLQQTSDAVSIEVKKIQNDGVSRVTTGMGYTFDENGLKIQKPGEQIGNLLDNTGMYVTRSGTVILQANAAGVTATDVKVNNFLVVGEHARFEAYSNGSDTKRVGCFFI